MTTIARHEQIAANLANVRARIAAAARRAGRDPAAVTLIAVSKTFPAEAVIAASRAGATDMGENRVQEAADKRALVDAAGIRPRWHLVGHLQTNKVRSALKVFDILHSIDSLRLAETISRAADRPIAMLIEVNVAGEQSKSGIAPEEVETVVPAIARLPHVVVRGLMTVAPPVADPEDVRPVFRRLRELRDGLGLTELSMGMSNDVEVAVEEGATLVRVGRAIFGERAYPVR